MCTFVYNFYKHTKLLIAEDQNNTSLYAASWNEIIISFMKQANLINDHLTIQTKKTTSKVVYEISTWTMRQGFTLKEQNSKTQKCKNNFTKKQIQTHVWIFYQKNIMKNYLPLSLLPQVYKLLNNSNEQE